MQTQTTHPKARTQRWPWLVAIVWIVAVLAGLVLLWRYAQTPAKATETLAQWPANSQITLSSHGETLLMFAHPHCPCTRASLGELERIVAQCQQRVTPWIVFFKPTPSESDWEDTDLRRTAKQIPNAHVVTDTDGKLASLFHVTTSGHTLLYNAAGQLLFSGGITAARGHEGDNFGRSAIVSLANGRTTKSASAPVFGCPIVEDAESP